MDVLKKDITKEFIDLLSNGDFNECKKIIKSNEEKNISISNIDYLKALYYDENNNPEYNEYYAKELFRKLFTDGKCNPYSYYRLSYYTEQHGQKLKILKKGLEEYPDSETLYYHLIVHSINKNEIYNDAVKNIIISDRINHEMFSYFLRIGDHKNVLQLIDKLKYEQNETILFIKFVKSISLYELHKSKDSIEILKDLLITDLSYFLELGPLYLQLNNYIRTRKYKLAIKLFLEIPNSEKHNYHLSCSELFIHFDYSNYVEKALDMLSEITEDKSLLGKLKKIRGLYYYYEKEIVKFSDLKYAIKYYPEDFEIYAPIVNYYIGKNEYYKSYKTCLEWIKVSNQNSPAYGINYYSNTSFITDADDTQFRKIYNDLIQFVNTNGKSNLIAKSFLYSIIKRLFSEKKYQQIVDLSNVFNVYDLQESNSLFEIAYSYSEVNNPQKGEEYYSRYLEKDGPSSAVLNNLGVIYERKYEYDKALEYFNKALSIDPDKELYKRNVLRTENKIQKDWDENIKSSSKMITSKKLEEIGYNRKYIIKIRKCFDEDYVNTLLRDIKEISLALVVGSYKSSIIMSGSAIESILLYLLNKNKIEAYQLLNKKIIVNEASINELLEIALTEKLLSKNLFHFSQGIKDFRNLIHPGVEQRKKMLKVDKDSAVMAWTVLKKIIEETTI